MARLEPTTTVACDHCGEMFKCSAVHPRRYCSIACEEGRRAPAMSDPRSPDYHLHLQANPESLVGKTLIANGLKRVEYAPDWCKDPSDWRQSELASVDRENLTYVRKDDVVLGRVVDCGTDGYTVEHENIETGEITTRTIDASTMVAQIRRDNWWVEG